MHSCRTVILVLLVIYCCSVNIALAASDINFSGEVKAIQQFAHAENDSVEGFLGKTSIEATNLSFRLKSRYSRDNLELNAHYLLNFKQGDAVQLENQLQALFPGLFIDQSDAQWMRLDHTLSSDDDSLLMHTLDRLNIRYSSEHLVLKFGRQALSWGNGLVFRPMDLFNPFAPNAVDTSYKPGIDMAYAQWLFNNGFDLAALAVPRRDPITGELDSKQGSAALKWHFFAQSLQSDLMLARDYQDTVAALALSGPWGEALWRLQWVPVYLHQGGERHSFLANVEDAWTWHGRNFSAYAEYFYNGFGVSRNDYTLLDLPSPLIDRLARGQVFNTGRNYLATGLRIEWTPLLQINPLLIVNINDSSVFLFLFGSYSVAENLSLDVGISNGFGADGSEFGGIETIAGSGIYYRPPAQVYAKLVYYF